MHAKFGGFPGGGGCRYQSKNSLHGTCCQFTNPDEAVCCRRQARRLQSPVQERGGGDSRGVQAGQGLGERKVHATCRGGAAGR